MNVPAAKQMQETLGGKMKKSLPRWWKKRHTAVITEADPSCKVVYLGNVLTGWAKGNDRQPHTAVLQDVESLVVPPLSGGTCCRVVRWRWGSDRQRSLPTRSFAQSTVTGSVPQTGCQNFRREP